MGAVGWSRSGYQVIYQHGGVYVNVDIEPVRSMGYLLEHYRVGHRAYAPYEDEGSLVVNAVLGGPEGHPFWERINEILPQRYWDMPGAEMNQVTGPHLLTELASSWNRNRSGDDEFVALAQESFNQVHWSQIPLGEDATGLGQDSPGVIGTHHWGHKKAGRTVMTVGRARHRDRGGNEGHIGILDGASGRSISGRCWRVGVRFGGFRTGGSSS